MAIEQGVVTKLGTEPQTAWVKVKPCSACESCSSRNSCNETGKIEEREVQAINTVGAEVGDHIQLSISTASLLKATFLLYLFPVICLLIGGLTGNAMAARFSMDSSLLSVCTALLCLAAAMLFVRFRGTQLAVKNEYRPRITRIIGRKAFQATAHGLPESSEAAAAEQVHSPNLITAEGDGRR